MSTTNITFTPSYSSSSSSTISNHGFHFKSQNPIVTSFCPSNITQSFNSCKLNAKRKVSIRAMGAPDESHGKGAPDNKKSSPSGWKKWAVGLTFSILVPSVGHKMPPLLILKSKLDHALETVESVSEVVEDLAEEAAKLAAEVDKRLPHDAKLKAATKLVEKLANAVDKEAERTQELIHKVEEAEKEVEELLEARAAEEKTSADQTKS